jgi:hypothetical protein
MRRRLPTRLGNRFVMRIVIACKCGQQFATKSRYIGRKVNCYKCGESMTIRAPHQPPPPPAAPPIQSARTNGVLVRCVCGWAFSAPSVLQGQSVNCPGCRGQTPVPLQDPLGLGYIAAGLPTIDPSRTYWLPRESNHRWAKAAAVLACISAALLPIALIVTTAIYNFARSGDQRPHAVENRPDSSAVAASR